MKDRSQWLDVAVRFSDVALRGAGSRRGAEALYTTGLIYENMFRRFNLPPDGQNAINAFQRLIYKYSSSSLVVHAERHIGDIRFTQRNNRGAEKIYSSAYKRAVASGSPAIIKSQTAEGYPGVTITEIRRHSQESYSRYVIFLSDKTAFRADKLINPDRVYVELLHANVGPNVTRGQSFESGQVRSIRVGSDGTVARIVFDLNRDYVHSITPLSNPYRLVVDFGAAPPAVQTRPPEPGVEARASGAMMASLPSAPGEGGIRTIVIDPGHGGKDPGAIGPSGLQEKDVTLALANRVASILKQRLNCRVVMTRSHDTSVELDDRTILANSVNADLFVSIHANSSRNRLAAGIETYFLSPARSQDELETAARENMIANLSGDPAENDITYIMSDMANTEKVNESVSLAKTVQKAMVRGVAPLVRVHDKGVKQAMFYVLWRATMPSILVEANFISNRYEERLLGNERYLDKLAESIADGVTQYSASYQVAMAH